MPKIEGLIKFDEPHKNGRSEESKNIKDQDILNKLMEHLDYEYNELGVKAQYIGGYFPSEDELIDKPKSPLLNW